MSLLRQGRNFVFVGLLQLLLDWSVFVAMSALGLHTAPSNLAGRVAGALLGFWLNGRLTFAQEGQAKLGWPRFLKFLVVWLVMTVISTLLITGIEAHLGLQLAWLTKPVVEGGLAVITFFLWRQLVYR